MAVAQRKTLVAPVVLPDREGNRRSRGRLRALWLVTPEAVEDIKHRCAGTGPYADRPKREAFFFWADNFCEIYDEEKPIERRIQDLILWEFQRDMTGEMVDNLFKVLGDDNERWNCGMDKCRGLAATFSTLLFIQWSAQFHGVSAIITSKTEADVEIAKNMNTPMTRLKWQVERQFMKYPFLFPEPSDTGPGFKHVLATKYDAQGRAIGVEVKDKQAYKSKLVNFGNGGQVSGMTPTGEAMRQARAIIWLGDEYAFVAEDYELWEAAAGTVRIRIICSTPKDPFCKYHRLIMKLDNEEIRVFELDWWMRPDRLEGQYIDEDGNLSSIWLDRVKANNSKQVLAREYLRDHNESIKSRVFWMFRNESLVTGLQPDNRVKNIYRIWDPGVQGFAVLWGQRDYYGNMLIFLEHVLSVEDVEGAGDTLLNKMARDVIKITHEKFKDFNILDIGDPYASRQQLPSQERKKTDYEILYERHKIRVKSDFMYKIASHEREEKGLKYLEDLMTGDCEETGSPQFMIDPVGCPKLLEAIEGKFRRKVKPSGEVEDEIVSPNHPFNDVVDDARMFALKLWHKREKTEEELGAQGPQAKKKETIWKPARTERRTSARTMRNVRRRYG